MPCHADRVRRNYEGDFTAPVRDVPPDWIGRINPQRDESERPVVSWWARHPDGTFTPVYSGSINPVTGKRDGAGR